MFDEWVRRDVGKVYVQMFDTALANWYGEPAGLCMLLGDLRRRALRWSTTAISTPATTSSSPTYLLGNITRDHA